MSDRHEWKLTVESGKFSQEQPRVPAGDPRGGQWTDIETISPGIPKSRKFYQLTPNQLKKIKPTPAMPTDEWFKENWKRTHHGKLTGWGMGKANWIVSNMSSTREYQQGLWQGRVDKARGLEYSEERSENTYNLGYYRGYSDYESNRRGWDRATRDRFDAQYVND